MNSEKNIDNITIAVAGAGAMGAGIAQACAQSGITVLLFDISAGALEKAESAIKKNLASAVEKGKITSQEQEDALKKITFSSTLETLKASVIIEAIIEKIQPKQDLFKKLSEIDSAETIFATNTSSIPITRIAAAVPNPERVVGMHFFNPVHAMKLVEVISGAYTSEEVAKTIFALAQKLGKQPVMVKDSPGFIVNRVARHFYVESLKVLEENVASFEDIDTLMESAGFKMGPFRLMDLVGNDINFSVTSSLFESFHNDPKFRPSRIQQQKVESGQLGKKTGRGFYKYEK